MTKGLEIIKAKIKFGEDYFLSPENLKLIEKELQALERACRYIAETFEECPASKGLVDDLECENCNEDMSNYWKRYFIEVVEKYGV